jgi:broad specificity phosphatase PhoE
VHVVRHGEVHNPEGVLYGRLPGYGLSERGVWMAQAAARSLSGRDIVHVAASPLERTRQTAAAFGADVAPDPRLIEAANLFEGARVSFTQGLWRHPRLWRHLANPFVPSWGESYLDIANRMRAALTEAREIAEGREAILVSHQLPIWTLRRSLEGRRLWHDPRRRECALASVTSFHFEGSALTGVTYREPALAPAG